MRSDHLILGSVLVAVSSLKAQIPRTRADSKDILVIMYHNAFQNGLKTAHASEAPALVCVGRDKKDAPLFVLSALADSTRLLIRPLSACRTEPLRSPSTGQSLVVDTLTGKRGITIDVYGPAFNADGTFTFWTSYYENGRSAGDWECIGEAKGFGWQVASCRLTRIS